MMQKLSMTTYRVRRLIESSAQCRHYLAYSGSSQSFVCDLSAETKNLTTKMILLR
jgi:hypothetical protein